MSGDWAWQQAVGLYLHYLVHSQFPDIKIQDQIAEDPITHGSMFVPIILGSDKTTVSVATGDNQYCRYIFLSATFITMFVVPIRMVLYFLDSYQSLKVCFQMQ